MIRTHTQQMDFESSSSERNHVAIMTDMIQQKNSKDHITRNNDSHASLLEMKNLRENEKMHACAHQLLNEWKKILNNHAQPPHVFVYSGIQGCQQQSMRLRKRPSVSTLTTHLTSDNLSHQVYEFEWLQLAKKNQFLRNAAHSEKECFEKIEKYVLGVSSCHDDEKNDGFLNAVENLLTSKYQMNSSEVIGKMIKMDLSLLSTVEEHSHDTHLSCVNYEPVNMKLKDLIDDYGLVLDVFSLLRFCHARKFDYQAVKTLIDETIAWRLYKKPHLITKESVQREYSKMKGFWLDFTKQNSPIIYIYPQNHVTYDRDFDECINYTLYMGEYGMNMIQSYNEEHVLPLLRSIEDGADLAVIEDKVLSQFVEQYTIVYDGRTVAMKNFDLAIIKEFLTLSSYYAERMKCVLVYNPSWSYKVLMKMVYQFLDKKTADKIKMVYNIADVEDVLDVTKVPKDFGGQFDYKFQ